MAPQLQPPSKARGGFFFVCRKCYHKNTSESGFPVLVALDHQAHPIITTKTGLDRARGEVGGVATDRDRVQATEVLIIRG